MTTIGGPNEQLYRRIREEETRRRLGIRTELEMAIDELSGNSGSLVQANHDPGDEDRR